MSNTPKPQEGIWTLTAPDGRKWQAATPLLAISAEIRERVPPDVALARIRAACEPTEDEKRIVVLEDALRPFATEFEIADAAGELQHWPPEEAKHCEAAWRALRK